MELTKILKNKSISLWLFKKVTTRVTFINALSEIQDTFGIYWEVNVPMWNVFPFKGEVSGGTDMGGGVPLISSGCVKDFLIPERVMCVGHTTARVKNQQTWANIWTCHWLLEILLDLLIFYSDTQKGRKGEAGERRKRAEWRGESSFT